MAAVVRRRPTRRQLEVLRAYIRIGSIAGAAYELDIAESTARQHLSGLYRRTGCLNAAQAACWAGVHEAERQTIGTPQHPLSSRRAGRTPMTTGS